MNTIKLADPGLLGKIQIRDNVFVDVGMVIHGDTLQINNTIMIAMESTHAPHVMALVNGKRSRWARFWRVVARGALRLAR